MIAALALLAILVLAGAVYWLLVYGDKGTKP